MVDQDESGELKASYAHRLGTFLGGASCKILVADRRDAREPLNWGDDLEWRGEGLKEGCLVARGCANGGREGEGGRKAN